jgi:CheY-like chemotaxis protein
MSDYILVVDDEPNIRVLFDLALKMAGFETQTVRGGLAAMQAVAESVPSLVLLDLMMPQVDGFEVLDNLRSDDKLSDVRVLVVTAKLLDADDGKKLKGWPVVGVLNKRALDINCMAELVQTALAHKPPASGEHLLTVN